MVVVDAEEREEVLDVEEVVVGSTSSVGTIFPAGMIKAVCDVVKLVTGESSRIS